jgi:hypothetical protein
MDSGVTIIAINFKKGMNVSNKGFACNRKGVVGLSKISCLFYKCIALKLHASR